MKAVRFDRFGDLDALRLEDVPLPDPAPGEVRVVFAMGDADATSGGGS